MLLLCGVREKLPPYITNCKEALGRTIRHFPISMRLLYPHLLLKSFPSFQPGHSKLYLHFIVLPIIYIFVFLSDIWKEIERTLSNGDVKSCKEVKN